MAKQQTDGMENTEKKEPVFSKEKVLGMKRYADRVDLLGVLLDDGKDYTRQEVESLLDDFMKGKVR